MAASAVLTFSLDRTGTELSTRLSAKVQAAGSANPSKVTH
jgi:hypothetical protein